MTATWRRAAPAAAVLLIALARVALGGAADTAERAPDPDAERAGGAAEPTAEARALTGGLALGEMLAGWPVAGVRGPTPDGEVRIELERAGARFDVWIVPKGARPERAPVETNAHAIYYGHVRPPERAPPAIEMERVASAVAARVRRAEAR